MIPEGNLNYRTSFGPFVDPLGACSTDPWADGDDDTIKNIVDADWSAPATGLFSRGWDHSPGVPGGGGGGGGRGGGFIDVFRAFLKEEGINNLGDFLVWGFSQPGVGVGIGAVKIGVAAKAVEKFLGGPGKIIKNADGDTILMRGNRKIRFDIKNSQGDKPHFHLEQQSPSGKWKDTGPDHRYYFSE